MLCGSFDVPLSATGRAQIRELHADLSLLRPDALYASTLVRALETAGAPEDYWRLGIRPDGSVREIDCGELEGIGIGRIQREHRRLWQRNQAQADDDFSWPAGESYRAFRARVLAGFARIAARHRGQRVAVVTHAGVITQILGVIRGRRAAVWEADRARHFSFTESRLDGRASARRAVVQSLQPGVSSAAARRITRSQARNATQAWERSPGSAAPFERTTRW